jgi:hypothetical protein
MVCCQCAWQLPRWQLRRNDTVVLAGTAQQKVHCTVDTPTATAAAAGPGQGSFLYKPHARLCNNRTTLLITVLQLLHPLLLLQGLAKARSFLGQLTALPDFLPAHLEELTTAALQKQQQQQQAEASSITGGSAHSSSSSSSSSSTDSAK